MTNRYDDIIHLQHPTSSKHPRMAALGRAAQFSPFAALTGYEGAIRETARLTDAKAELDENKLAVLDLKLRILADRLTDSPEVSITYFKPDEKKDGGAYKDAVGTVKKIDAYEQAIIMADATVIPIEDIFEITGDLFASLNEEEIPRI